MRCHTGGSNTQSIKSYFSAAPIDSDDDDDEEEEESGFRASDAEDEDNVVEENSVSEAEFDDEEEEEEEEYKAPSRGKRGAGAGAGAAKKKAAVGGAKGKKTAAPAAAVASGNSRKVAAVGAGRSNTKAIDSSIEGIDDDSAEDSDMHGDFTGRSSIPTQQSIRLPVASAGAGGGIDAMIGGKKRGVEPVSSIIGKSQQGARKGRSARKTDWDD